MARKPRVVIPENPGELMKLTGLVYAQHQKLGTKSPLVILDSPTWDELGPEVQKTAAVQVRIEELERELKNLYGQRDPNLETFTDLARRSRDILLAKHAANPAALGDYGFDVIEAPAPGTGSTTNP
ncbi:hypothetical protein [Hymenobacter negativus]|uniref:Uncharacterized protein n=1 Tax=Hymenobacter negativus TaxID=2795026 RepID=A0ABS3QGF3_9BACT|nr:hypothetical protein [Hymenobacter negativus]MBO2010324.1 hypothetical protein [Hymenobacter negativus]